MQFNDIIGQEHIKAQLVSLVGHNRLSHALLFLGKEGSGALPLALALAQYMVCEKVNAKIQSESVSLFEEIHSSANKDILTDSCGTCPPCVKAGQLAHPDIHYSYPVVSAPKKKKSEFTDPDDEKKSKGNRAIDFIKEWREFIWQYPYGNLYDWINLIKETENQQGKITAKECEDIIHKLSLKSFESEYKILVMWMPENLEKEGNKLLKLIEEPPANTLFILVATDESLILPTIVSRTQLVKIPGLETREIENALVERAKLSQDQARQIASVSDGNFREALQLMQHAEEDWQSLLRDWLNAILKTGPVAQVKWVDEISKLGREKQKQFLRYFNHLLEQAIKIRIVGSEANFSVEPAPNSSNTHGNAGRKKNSSPGFENNGSKAIFSMPQNEKDFALRLNKITTLSQQSAIIEEIDKGAYYIERNANAKMLFQALTIKMYHIITDQTVPTIL